MGIGAYTASWLSSQHGWPFLPAALVGLVVVAPVGMMLAFPALRLRGLELSVLTLGVSLAATALVFDSLAPLRFDPHGAPLGGVPKLGPFDLSSSTQMYFFLVGIAVLAFLGVAAVLRSRVGKAWKAMRAGNAVAAGCGIQITTMQVIGFGVSALVAGLAGVMLLTLQSTVTPDSFSAGQSIFLVVVSLIAGTRRIEAAIFGGLVVGVGQHIFKTYGMSGDWVTFVFGLVVVARILRTAPRASGAVVGA
jgi:branched-chain amino acid transport system permease protein